MTAEPTAAYHWRCRPAASLLANKSLFFPARPTTRVQRSQQVDTPFRSVLKTQGVSDGHQDAALRTQESSVWSSAYLQVCTHAGREG